MYIHTAFGTWPFGKMRFVIFRPCVVLKPCLAQSAGLSPSNAGSGTKKAGTTPAGATGASVEATSGAAPSALTFFREAANSQIHTHTPFLDLSQMPTPLNFFTVDCIKQVNFVNSSSLDRFLSRPQLQDLRNLGQFCLTSYLHVVNQLLAIFIRRHCRVPHGSHPRGGRRCFTFQHHWGDGGLTSCT